MKKPILEYLASFVLLVLCVLCFLRLASAGAADSRTITEGSTNILAIGIDNRDFDVIRFYLRGNRVLELRPEDILHLDRHVIRPPLPPNLLSERSNLVARLGTFTNEITAINATAVISNIVRLQQIDERLR